MAEKTSSDERNQVADRPHFWTLALSGIAVVISVASFVQSYRVTEIAREKAEALVYSTDVIFRRPPLSGKGLYPAVTLRNYGETPATNIKTVLDMQFVGSGQKLPRVFHEQTQDSYIEEILASQDFTQINYHWETPLSKLQYAGIMNRKLVLFFYGKTEYDTRDKHKTLSWCWKYNSELKEFWRCDPDDFAVSARRPNFIPDSHSFCSKSTVRTGSRARAS